MHYGVDLFDLGDVAVSILPKTPNLVSFASRKHAHIQSAPAKRQPRNDSPGASLQDRLIPDRQSGYARSGFAKADMHVPLVVLISKAAIFASDISPRNFLK